MKRKPFDADAVAERRLAMLGILLLLLAALCMLGESAKAKPPLKQDKPAATVRAPVQYTATEISSAMRASWKPSWGDKAKYYGYAKLFVKNAGRWGVSPLVVACVAYAESRYHATPPKLMRERCRTKLVGCNQPGPCWPRYKRICKRVQINTAEAGMMQVLFYDRSTKVGYKKCTGRKLTGRRAARKRKLSSPEVAICVGTYELSKWKRWVGKRKRRQRPRAKANKAFFRRHPKLLQYFWTGRYNWGSNRWVGNSYPRVIALCVQRYQRHITGLRAKK